MMHIIIFMLCLINAIGSSVLGQTLERQFLGTLGKSVNRADIEVDYAIGDAVIQTYESHSLMLTQGFIQPLDIIQVSVLPNKEIIKIFSFYPNPTYGELFLKVATQIPLFLRLELFSLDGKMIRLLEQDKFISSEESEIPIVLAKLSPGVYIISSQFYNASNILQEKQLHKIVIY